eukprot:CAMPEP_0178432344 /NCGR_PEP_ID=MMETSP0689_2-20121128/32332_1 /TAXON_ID=160604 /ORGANISM="Amphidinium massartii, Strain CS-259" /LENGTH=326 /DNA_ID=CAMNT_0020054319 /DNA_START=9 /DNA_END=989 /DNA_ORIENTATION=-
MVSDLVGRVVFGTLIVASLLVAWPVAVLGACLRVWVSNGWRKSFDRRVADVLIVSLVLAWRLVFTLCPWIELDIEGLREFQAGLLAQPRRSAVLLCNHTSFLESILAVSCAPIARAGDFRVLVANKIFNIPLLGRVMRTMGLAEVPFKGSADDVTDFRVDRAAMDERLSAFECHVREGGIGSWFPEGSLNRSDPTQLQLFRAGAFGVPAKVDVEIWCMVQLGCSASWRLQDLMGGRPARISVKFFRFCSSSAAFLSDAQASIEAECGGSPKDRAEAVYLANATRERMQQVLNELASTGFASRFVPEGDGRGSSGISSSQLRAPLVQ